MRHTPHYLMPDPDEVRRLIRAHPWATIVSPAGTGLVPHPGRLEWMGRIEAPIAHPLPTGPVARVLDTLDIILATGLSALFAAARR